MNTGFGRTSYKSTLITTTRGIPDCNRTIGRIWHAEDHAETVTFGDTNCENSIKNHREFHTTMPLLQKNDLRSLAQFLENIEITGFS